MSTLLPLSLTLALVAAVGPKAEPKEWGNPFQGLAAAIWADRTTFKVGEPVVVHFRIKNVSTEEQTVWHCGFFPNTKVIVLDAAGREVALTALGKQGRDVFQSGSRRKNVPFTLAPGAADTALPTFDLRLYFVLDRPGKYSVQYLYSDTKEQAVFSNVLTITLE